LATAKSGQAQDYFKNYFKIREPDGLMAQERRTKPGIWLFHEAYKSTAIWRDAKDGMVHGASNS